MTDTPAAIEFLKQWEPEGPWVLTAIAIDRKSIATYTFDINTLHECEQWIDLYNGQRNIYFHVNPTIGPMDKKALREDIAAVKWLHVDVDPRIGEDLQEEQDRAYQMLFQPPGEVPPPTVVIFSGGGYQGFWRLQDPIEINGDIDLAEDAKRYNLQLEILFGADNCHNIDRIMRLPGTVNIPDAKKKKKGRKAVTAKVEVFDHSRVYPINAFTAATPTQRGDSFFQTAAQKVEVSGNIPRVQSMDELDEWDVPDRVRVIIVQGRHPDEGPKEDDSRSSWLFDVVCNLVRCNVPDETIYSIITDQDFAISESVLDKGSNAESYALRQISKAKEFVIDPHLAEMNNRYAVIMNLGGRCRVIEEQMDPVLKRYKMTMMAFSDFKNAHSNRKVQVGVDKDGNPRKMPLGEWWLGHEDRRQFERVVFVPNKEISGAYNLWKGYSCDAVPGDWDRLKAHILENICQGSKSRYDYLIKWIARMVQRPGEPGQVAVVLRGGQGTGKSFFANQIGKLLGRHYMQVSNPGHLVGNFNSHLRDCVFLFADEAFFAGDRKHEGVLRSLVTEDSIPIEAKGVDTETAVNCIHLMLASNQDWVIPANARNERRYFMLDVGEDHQRDTDYFRAIDHQMKNGGLQAFLYDLLNVDLSEFNVRNVPHTKELREQQRMNFTTEEKWWYEKLHDGFMFNSNDTQQVPWPEKVVRDSLYENYLDFARDIGTRHPLDRRNLGRFLSKVADPTTFQSPPSQGRRYCYVFKNIHECRKIWESLYGEQEWPVIEELPPDYDEEPENEEIPF